MKTSRRSATNADPARSTTRRAATTIGARPQVAIGVIGPHDLVDRLVALAAQAGNGRWRLVTSVHRHERDTAESLRRIEANVDVVLFAGELQYELARQAGDVSVPATYIPISGAELYAPLISGLMSGECDPRRVSIDSFPRRDIEEIYEDIQVSTADVHAIPYRDAGSVREFAAFHEQQYAEGRTTAAFTSVLSVAEHLRAIGVPTYRTLPTTSTLRSALTVAALLGVGGRLEDSQVTIAMVRLARSIRPVDALPGDYPQQELKLALNQALLKVARPIGASVHAIDDAGYLMTLTYGSAFEASDGFTRAPFIAEVEAAIGVPVEVGIGLGRTVRDAEAHAYKALAQSSAAGPRHAYVIDAARQGMLLSTEAAGVTLEPAAEVTRAHEIAHRLVALSGDGSPVVDAEDVARLLHLTPRSARRILNDLVTEGLAWPVAPATSNRAGRPRQPYRLVIGGQDRDSARMLIPGDIGTGEGDQSLEVRAEDANLGGRRDPA